MTRISDHFPSKPNSFTLLRFILASAVVFCHSFSLGDGSTERLPFGDTTREPLYYLSGEQVFGGSLAVYFFFVLSGFLISHSYHNSGNNKVYIAKRILRIYPGFIFAVLIGSLLLAPLSIGYESFYSQLKFSELLQSVSLLQFPAIPQVFLNNPYAGEENGSLWTIKIEFFIYLLICLIGSVGLLKKKWALIFFGLFYSFHCFKQLRPGLMWEMNFPMYPFGELFEYPELLTYFFAGVVFYIYRDKIPLNPRYALISILAFIASFWGGMNLVLPICGSYLLIFAGLKYVPEKLSDTYGVDISYGIYLYSFPIQQSLLHFFPDTFVREPYYLFLGSFPISCAFGYLSWQLIESRALKLKRLM